MSTKISATIVADSINKQGDRITTMEIVFPRFILAEAKTHRIISGLHEEVDISINSFKEGSKNSASSRAIPFNKMVEMVENDPFIPIAWQKDHKGMQGTEYFTDPSDIEELNQLQVFAANKAAARAKALSNKGVTKQLCNRWIEPFMWHKVLITATEWENFFSLRCPVYQGKNTSWKSWKDMIEEAEKDMILSVSDLLELRNTSDLEKLEFNKGQAEIHMMTLAEAMWDARNESTPKLLKPGEWHIPYGDKMDDRLVYNTLDSSHLDDLSSFENHLRIVEGKIKVSTGMCARVSYTTVGDEKEVKYETLIGIHDKMLKADPFHASPFEHCSQAMTDEEYERFVKVIPSNFHPKTKQLVRDTQSYTKEEYGWCRNYRGYKQYRHIIEN